MPFLIDCIDLRSLAPIMTSQHEYQPALFELHQLDLTLAEIKKKTGEEKVRVENFANSIKTRTRERGKQDQTLKTAQVDAKTKELELEDLTTRKAKKEKQVLMVVNPRELDAINAEIARLSELIPAKEAELLDVYDRVEKAQAALHITDEDLKKRAAHVPKLKADVEAKLAQLAEQLRQAVASRAQVEPAVEATALAKYTKAREQLDVPLLFEITENACGGCGMPRPGFEWNKLRSNPGNVYACSDCQRLNVYTGEAPS